jgi:[NiFe] hydrogenase assembly HybE family chaperone
VPAGEDDWPEARAGATLCVDLPAGTFEFIVAEDEVLGRFLMCSLFSPVLEFTAQSAALDVAEQAMTLLFVTDAAAAVDAAEHGKPCSRRQFLRVRRDVNEHA